MSKKQIQLIDDLFRGCLGGGVVIVALLFTAGCRTCPAAQKPSIGPANLGSQFHAPKVLASATILAAGDILMHGAVKKSAAAADVRDEETGESKNFYGFQVLFEELNKEIGAADIAFANLETPISTTQAQGAKAFVFNAPFDLLLALKNLGFDVLSVANNHMYDQDEVGLPETLEQLKNSGIAYVGSGRNKEEAGTPLVVEKNGVKVAFLGFTEFINKNLNVDVATAPQVNVFDPTLAIIAIGKARGAADFVVVSIHWGSEYKSEAPKRIRDLARTLFEAGADVVLGHHPHVLQPIEVYKAQDGRYCSVIYSLGNFISNQSRAYVNNVAPDAMGDTRDSALLHFQVERRDYGRGVVRCELAKVYYDPIWTENDELDRKISDPPRIRVVSLSKAIARVRGELEEWVGETVPKDNLPEEKQAKYLELSRTLEALGKRRQRILERLGDEYAR